VDYLSELHLNLTEKLPRDYNFEGQLFIRKTDNPRIEPRRDLRLKQFNGKVYNPQNLVEFGDFYGDFSQFVLGSTLEGVNTEITPSTREKYKFIAGRTGEADEAASFFQRDVFGVKADRYLFENSDLFSNFRLGAQAVTVHDDSGTLELRTASTKELHNTVASVDGEMIFRKVLSFIYEIANSSYMADKGASRQNDNSFAVRLQPSVNLGKTHLRYQYYQAQPKFYSAVGSVAPDKIQHQLTADLELSAKALLSLTENLYWDHLPGSSLTKRTTSDEKYLTLSTRPFDGRKNFVFRPYASYQARTSDDPGHSSSGTTRTGGFSISDSLDASTTAGINYEYRGFTDSANRTSSDYFHRIGLNLARDQQLFSRRLYYSVEPEVDLRSAKSSSKKDVTFNLGLNAQYDITSSLVTRLGNNLADTNSSKPNANYLNNRSFCEFDFLVNRARAAHFVLRGERNRFVSEDGNQTYNEERLIGRFITNF
jgi:hypothetical protein